MTEQVCCRSCCQSVVPQLRAEIERLKTVQDRFIGNGIAEAKELRADNVRLRQEIERLKSMLREIARGRTGSDIDAEALAARLCGIARRELEVPITAEERTFHEVEEGGRSVLKEVVAVKMIEQAAHAICEALRSDGRKCAVEASFDWVCPICGFGQQMERAARAVLAVID